MADCKQNITKHLTSAQQWLSKAEEAFEKDRDIRGELNLFLAQAELTRAKETNRSLHWRYRYPIIRHSMAIVLALVIAVGGLTASYLWGINRQEDAPPLQTDSPVPVSQTWSNQFNESAGVMKPATTISAPEASASKTVADKDRTTVSPQLSAPPATDKQPNFSAQSQQEQAAPLTPDEVNHLIRLAGKSLRGQ